MSSELNLRKNFEILMKNRNTIQERQDRIDLLAENILYKMDIVLSKLKSVQESYEKAPKENAHSTSDLQEGKLK